VVGMVVGLVVAGLVCCCSLRGRWGGDGDEGETQTMTLEDVSPEVFNLKLEWVYSQDIKDGIYDLMQLVQLWELGQRLLIPKLQNVAMKTLPKQLKFGATEDVVFPRELLECICDILSNSPLYLMLVNYLSWGRSTAGLGKVVVDMQAHLTEDVMVELKIEQRRIIALGYHYPIYSEQGRVEKYIVKEA